MMNNEEDQVMIENLSDETEKNDETAEEPNDESNRKRTRPPKPFPNFDLEEALKIPQAIAKNNAGNPWSSEQVATAVAMSYKSSVFYYLTTASRDYGLTTGTSRAKQIELTTLGRKIVFPENPTQEIDSLKQAFFNIDIFRQVFEYYKGGELPEKRYVCNTLQETFKLASSYHEDFLEIFKSNISFLKRKSALNESSFPKSNIDVEEQHIQRNGEIFVIMPFTEKTEMYPEGYFEEVYNSLIVPAASQAGYSVKTANRSGSDIIHKTIVNSIFQSELILADLTEHNPNVLFELGLAIAFKKKVALIRAKGTPPIFDVDNSMRVLDYSPNLWKSTLEMDVSRLAKHIEMTASSNDYYLDIFLSL